MSRSALPAGGCRSSGWALVLLAVALLALVFLLACGFGVSFSWAPTQRPVFFRKYPPDGLGLWLPATEASRVGGTHGRVRRDGSDGWRSLVPRGDNTGERVQVPHLPTIVCLSRRLVPNFVMDSLSRLFWDFGSLYQGRCGVILACCRGSRNFVQVAAATSAACRGTSQQNAVFQMFLQLQKLRRHASRAVEAAVSFSLKDVAASQYVCSCDVDNTSFSFRG